VVCHRPDPSGTPTIGAAVIAMWRKGPGEAEQATAAQRRVGSDLAGGVGYGAPNIGFGAGCVVGRRCYVSEKRNMGVRCGRVDEEVGKFLSPVQYRLRKRGWRWG
jgi:hypothetical protein